MDNKLTYKDLKNMAKLAKEKNLCLAVEVTIPGQEETEIIINRPSSIDNKLKYYLGVYDENLAHRMNNAIKMVQISVVDVEELLFEAYKRLDPKDVVGIK